jgi:hypothetical protein
MLTESRGKLKALSKMRQEYASGNRKASLRVAILRAAHQLLDVPLVFEDAFALKILGAVEEDSLRNDPKRYNSPRLKGLRASLVVRSSLAEEEWARQGLKG